MATNNYFSYGGTQYAQPNAAYQPTQQAYGVQSATGGASVAPSFTSQRSSYDATYQTAATPVSYTAPAAVGVTYDSTKTFYQQTSVAVTTGPGAVTVGSNSDFSSWQQANYNARQSTVAAVAANKVAFGTSYSAPPTNRQLSIPPMAPKLQTTNASSYVAAQFNNQQPSIANPNFNYSSSPGSQTGNKASVGTIGQPPKKVIGQFQHQKQTSPAVGMSSNHNTLNSNLSSLYNLGSAGNIPSQNPGMPTTAYPSIPPANYSNTNVGGTIYNSTSGTVRPKGAAASTVATPTTYSNTYDQALFNAAATMYMNQNPRAAAKTGNNYKPRPGLGTNPKFRNIRPPKPQQLHYCDACKISCAGPSAYHDHLQGQKHKKKVAKAKPEQAKKNTFAGNLPVFVCELCDVECTAADAYAAHLRGAKHTKVVKLHTKLGKPIPPPDPKAAAAIAAFTAQEEAAKTKIVNGSVTPVVAISSAPVTKLVTPRITFVAASNSGNISNSSISVTSSAPVVTAKPEIDEEEAHVEERGESELLIDDRPAVGSEYIEEEKDATGKLISFNCKLCECKFSDPNAKEMHMKGRKHRLQFKRKVDPKLKVEMKPNNFKNKRNEKWKKQVDKQKDVKRKDMRYDDEFKDYFDWCRKSGAGPATIPGLLPQGIRHPLLRSPRPLMIGPGSRIPVPQQASPPMFLFGVPSLPPFSRKVDTPEDRHVLTRHRNILPVDSEVRCIQKHLDYIEKALKLVSDHMLEESEMMLKTKAFSNDTESLNKMDPSQSENISEISDVENTSGIDESLTEREEHRGAVRELTGVLRVGIIAKGLVLNGDTNFDLVMLCNNKPTVSLLSKVVSLLPDQLKEVSNGHNYTIQSTPSEAALEIKNGSDEDERVLTIKVTLTSTVIRKEINAVIENEDPSAAADGCKVSKEIIPDPPDVLNKMKCLEALAALRHAKWFQARAASVQSCLIIIRVLRDLCKREPSWAHFNSWALELLSEKVLSSANTALSPGDGLRRVFECISSGILLPDGPGLVDPCEKDPVDALSTMTLQQRENITAYAQYALRLIAFRQIHNVLGMDMLPPAPKFRNKQTNRKRRRENSAGGRNEGIDGKKDKKDAENEAEEEQEQEEYGNGDEYEGEEDVEEESAENAEKMEMDVKVNTK